MSGLCPQGFESPRCRVELFCFLRVLIFFWFSVVSHLFFAVAVDSIFRFWRRQGGRLTAPPEFGEEKKKQKSENGGMPAEGGWAGQKRGQRESNPRPQDLQSYALPLSYNPGVGVQGVPVAQLDKAPDYESGDWGFKSLQGYFFAAGGQSADRKKKQTQNPT